MGLRKLSVWILVWHYQKKIREINYYHILRGHERYNGVLRSLMEVGGGLGEVSDSLTQVTNQCKQMGCTCIRQLRY